MKRKKQVDNFKLQANNARFWAFIFCIEENLAIAISRIPITVRNVNGQLWPDKVGDKQWKGDNCDFRSDEYKIDFENVKPGDRVYCPKCNSLVDFRVIPAHTIPKFTNVKKN